jgi:hypothetical protein
VDGFISYLNTGFDLTSADDLEPLAAAFEAAGVPPSHATRGDDGLWYGSLETGEQHALPELNIEAMLAAVESLAPPLRSVWAVCSR